MQIDLQLTREQTLQTLRFLTGKRSHQINYNIIIFRLNYVNNSVIRSLRKRNE